MGILGHGIYNLPEAARLTGLKPQRVGGVVPRAPEDRGSQAGLP